METKQRIALAGATATAVVLVAFLAGYTLGRGGPAPQASKGQGSGQLEVVSEAYKRIREAAVKPPNSRALARGAVRGMVEVLNEDDDPYALFYSPEGYRSFQELTSGRFSGIGVWLKQKGADLEIVSVLPSTPAETAGLQRGDVVKTVDGSSVEGLTIDEAVARIKGRSGTEVSIGVSREGEPLAFTITRRSIELPNLVARMSSDRLGYVRLLGFARGAGEQLREKVSELTQRGAEGIVLDLRDNGGGLFSEGIDVASVFIDDGTIVSYKARSRPERVYEARGNAFESLPLVVLVNEGTASASEIVAGALQDRERAIVVGEETYGKGSVQEVFPLSDASAVKLTTGSYFTPRGRNITGDGIEPDVEVTASRTAQRRRAVEILRGIVLSTSGAQG